MKCRFSYFYRKGPKISAILFFQVIDVIDNPPEFKKKLFSAGINPGDKVNDVVTTLDVSIKLQLTLRTEATCHKNITKDTFVGQDSKRS